MNISSNILQGVLLGLGTLALTTASSETVAQKRTQEKQSIQRDTVRVDCHKPGPKVVNANPPESSTTLPVQSTVSDTTKTKKIIYRDYCPGCGRG